MGEFETGAAIERLEALAREREGNHQHGAGFSAGAVDDVSLTWSMRESGMSDT